MSQLALVVHEVLSSPHLFSETSENAITNGYYKIDLDANRYGMGTSWYHAEAADKEVLTNAINEWKKLTRWHQRDVEVKSDKSEIKPVYDEPLHMKFSNQVRVAHTSFLIHKNPNTLAENIGKFISEMDNIIGQSKRS